MDKHYREDMTVDEAVALMDMCCDQVRNRLVVAPPKYVPSFQRDVLHALPLHACARGISHAKR